MTEQSTLTAPAHRFEPLPDLPDKITLRDGQVVDVSGYVWRMTRSADIPTRVTIDWKQLLDLIARETSLPIMSERAVRLVMLFTAEKLSKTESKSPIKSKSAHNYMWAALYLSRWLEANPDWLPSGRSFDWSDMTEDLFDAWLTSEYVTNRKGHKASLIRSFYRWGVKKDFPDFSRALASVLDGLNIKGPAVGEVVAARDDRRGPFSSDEMDLILAACEAGRGTDQDRAITWTLLDTTIRPEQMYRLTNRDLFLRGGERGDDDADGAYGNHKYWLRVEIIKQRKSVTQFVNLPLSKGCFQLLRNLRKSEDDPNARLFWWLGSGFCSKINWRLKVFIKEADLRSPRLPVANQSPDDPLYELLPVNPCRFRYGMATERIALGETEENVAHSLCHTSAGSVRIYTNTSPRIADDFQRATDYAILPLVRRMEGCPGDNSGGVEPHSVIADRVSSPREVVPFMDDNSGKRSELGREVERIVLPVEAAKVAERIAEMVKSARRRFPNLYPGQNFDNQVWNVRHRVERPNATRSKSLGFTTLASTKYKISRDRRDALPTYFANVIKSWVVLDGHVSASYDVLRLNAARHLWNFISARVGSKDIFSWCSLAEDDFLSFEYHLREYRPAGKGYPLGNDTVLRIIAHTQSLTNFLASRGICRGIDYIPQTTSQRAIATQTLSGKELAAKDKLPASGVLEALADIYYRLTTAPAGEVSDWTLIRISAVAILMFTGMRLGEILTLPFDCEVEEKIPARQPGETDSYRYGLRYWVEKTRKKTLRVKWISPTAEPIVREAVKRIKGLTADARRRAKVLEDNPTEVPLPADVAGLTTLTRRQVISLLGYKDGSGLSRIPHKILPRKVVQGHVYYRVEDVKAFLLSRRVPELYTFRCDGKTQMLSESLFVVFRNQGDFRRTNKCELLIEPLKEKSLGYFLSPSGLRLTVFSEFGRREKERALITTPHAFRHWLIHTAYNGGMPERLVLRYFEKRSGSDIMDYIHSTPEEVGSYVPDELRAEYASV